MSTERVVFVFFSIFCKNGFQNNNRCGDRRHNFLLKKKCSVLDFSNNLMRPNLSRLRILGSRGARSFFSLLTVVPQLNIGNVELTWASKSPWFMKLVSVPVGSSFF